MTRDTHSESESPDAAGAAAFGLLTIPASFTQDRLLRTEDVIREAARLGVTVGVDALERLHRERLLIPLFVVTDEPDVALAVSSIEPVGLNPRGWTFDAAREGRLRDPQHFDAVDAFPYARPEGADRRWWDGYIYSQWHLVELPHALADAAFLPEHQATLRARAQVRRLGTLAAAALATRYMPDVAGQISFPGGIDHEVVWKSRYDWTAERRLAAVGVPPVTLRGAAERYLRWAHRDPLIGWWPVIRHAGHRGWSKIDGLPALCIQHRILAELLLRADEELAETGLVEALDPPSGMGLHAFDDRIAPPRGRRSLDAELASLGVSPHPRVVMIVEGKTERLHVRAIADELGIDRPNMLRVVDLGGSKVRPDLVARYVATPRLGTVDEGPGQELDVLPTAVMIAMDPENLWRTVEDRRTRLRVVHDAVRAAVEEQGGRITQQELDFLVEVHTWDDQTYEFANFTDDELGDALMQLGTERDVALDRGTVVAELAKQRADRRDIGVALARLRLGADKVRLAELLRPALLRDLETATRTRPVVEVVLTAQQKVVALLGGAYVLSGDDP
jgi:hypothetical protein